MINKRIIALGISVILVFLVLGLGTVSAEDPTDSILNESSDLYSSNLDVNLVSDSVSSDLTDSNVSNLDDANDDDSAHNQSSIILILL